MGQVSLPVTNKTPTAMIWHTSYFNKKHRTLSTNDLFFLTYFFKEIIGNRNYIYNIFWKNNIKIKITDNKFYIYSKPYILELSGVKLLLYTYYYTDLEHYINLGKSQVGVKKKITKDNFIFKFVFSDKYTKKNNALSRLKNKVSRRPRKKYKQKKETKNTFFSNRDKELYIYNRSINRLLHKYDMDYVDDIETYSELEPEEQEALILEKQKEELALFIAEYGKKFITIE